MPRALPLPTLLSQALVAFTIEFDNEFERRMPHRTTTTPSPTATGPWLVSMVMWSNVMRLVPQDGITERELQRLARTKKLNLPGLKRWGYISVGPDRRIRPTAYGRMAQETWRAVSDVIDQEWRARYAGLDAALSALVTQLDVELPEYLPVLGYGLFADVDHHARHHADNKAANISALLAKPLLAFALDFEHEWPLSLATSANVLRLLDDSPVRVRDLPPRSGVSKEATAMALGFLAKHQYVVKAASTVRLTPKGVTAREAYRHRLTALDQRWASKYGLDTVQRIRAALEQLDLKPVAPPDGWRASLRAPDTFPHYPMVLHRGGYPDGS